MPIDIDLQFPRTLELTSVRGQVESYDLEPRIYLPHTEEDGSVIGSIIAVRYLTARYTSEHLDELFSKKK